MKRHNEQAQRIMRYPITAHMALPPAHAHSMNSALVVVPGVAADHRKGPRWGGSSWTEENKLAALSQCVAENLWAAQHGHIERTKEMICATLNFLPSFKSQGTLYPATLMKMLNKELTTREVQRKADLHGSGVGDQECTDYTRSLDDALQLRDDADDLKSGKSVKSAAERARQARLKEQGDIVRASSLGLVTARRKAPSPAGTPSPALKRFRPQEVMATSQKLQQERYATPSPTPHSALPHTQLYTTLNPMPGQSINIVIQSRS